MAGEAHRVVPKLGIKAWSQWKRMPNKSPVNRLCILGFICLVALTSCAMPAPTTKYRQMTSTTDDWTMTLRWPEEMQTDDVATVEITLDNHTSFAFTNIDLWVWGDQETAYSEHVSFMTSEPASTHERIQMDNRWVDLLQWDDQVLPGKSFSTKIRVKAIQQGTHVAFAQMQGWFAHDSGKPPSQSFGVNWDMKTLVK